MVWIKFHLIEFKLKCKQLLWFYFVYLWIRQLIGEALGDAASNVYALASEGVAALWSSDAGQWVGSLAAFESENGYWLVATNDFSFSFNSNGGSLARAAVLQEAPRAVPGV